MPLCDDLYYHWSCYNYQRGVLLLLLSISLAVAVYFGLSSTSRQLSALEAGLAAAAIGGSSGMTFWTITTESFCQKASRVMLFWRSTDDDSKVYVV
jgi:hypothetical protein